MNYWNYSRRSMDVLSSAKLEQILSIAILILMAGIAFILILYFLKISSVIAKGRKNRIHQPIIDIYLNRIATCDISILHVALEFREVSHFQDATFRELMLKELLFARNYMKEVLKNRIQKFYFYSGLVDYSHLKLLSNKWQSQCKAMTELAQMDAISYYDDILSFRFSKNNNVRLHAVLSLIKLKGGNAYHDVSDFDHKVNKWAVANVIELIRDLPEGELFDYKVMLNSGNNTIKMIGLSLIKHFELKNLNENQSFGN